MKIFKILILCVLFSLPLMNYSQIYTEIFTKYQEYDSINKNYTEVQQVKIPITYDSYHHFISIGDPEGIYAMLLIQEKDPHTGIMTCYNVAAREDHMVIYTIKDYDEVLEVRITNNIRFRYLFTHNKLNKP